MRTPLISNKRCKEKIQEKHLSQKLYAKVTSMKTSNVLKVTTLLLTVDLWSTTSVWRARSKLLTQTVSPTKKVTCLESSLGKHIGTARASRKGFWQRLARKTLTVSLPSISLRRWSKKKRRAKIRQSLSPPETTISRSQMPTWRPTRTLRMKAVLTWCTKLPGLTRSQLRLLLQLSVVGSKKAVQCSFKRWWELMEIESLLKTSSFH